MKEDYKFLEEICIKRSKELEIELEIQQSNLEGEIVNFIQKARNNKDISMIKILYIFSA